MKDLIFVQPPYTAPITALYRGSLQMKRWG